GAKIDLVFVAGRVVDTGDPLVLIQAVAGGREFEEIRSGGCGRKVLVQIIVRKWANAAGGNLIVGKRRSAIIGIPDGGLAGDIARALRCGERAVADFVRRAANLRPLVARKEEQLVLHDRSADRASILISL